jgi:hypothetical protein
MKPKVLIASAIVVAVAAGYFFGRWHTLQSIDNYYAKVMRPEAQRATADFSRAAGVLKAIRSGDNLKAIEDLEEGLDTNILLIGAVTEATPVSERDKQWLSRIRWLRDYRVEHPRTTEFPAIDEQVAQILSLVEAK